VVFTGEPGDDLGGPRKEYFQLMIKKLLDLNFGMFQLKGEGKFLWFNGKSWEAPVMF
jgi:ubiquitin-protein ligase E3 A